MHVQGRLEMHTALALEYLKRNGLVERAKAQPFVTAKLEFGAEIYPDFLVVTTSTPAELVVLETKTSRFLTHYKHLELESCRKRFSDFGLRYVVWTDLRPLTSAVRHNLVNMRRGHYEVASFDERRQLKEWVTSEPNPTVAKAYDCGFDIDVIYAAAWEASVFFQLTQRLAPQSQLTVRPQDDLRAQFLDCDNGADSWWRGLTRLNV